MYEVTYSIEGIIHTMKVMGNNYSDVFNIVTNMFGSGYVQIINIRRI